MVRIIEVSAGQALLYHLGIPKSFKILTRHSFRKLDNSTCHRSCFYTSKIGRAAMKSFLCSTFALIVSAFAVTRIERCCSQHKRLIHPLGCYLACIILLTSVVTTIITNIIHTGRKTTKSYSYFDIRPINLSIQRYFHHDIRRSADRRVADTFGIDNDSIVGDCLGIVATGFGN